MINEILPNEVAAQIDQLSVDLISNVLTQLPREVFHYTSAKGVLGILSEAQIRATNISFLNDSTEYQHSIDGFNYVVRHNLKPNLPNHTGILLKKLEEHLTNASNNNMVPPVYVSCFSEIPDSLSQWRGYGHGEGGFAIGFEVEKLVPLVLDQDALLWPCIYEPQKQASLYEKILLKLDRIFHRVVSADAQLLNSANFLDEFVKYSLIKLSAFAPQIKHHAFKEEIEWRIVRITESWAVDKLKFVDRGTTLSGFYPIRLASQSGASARMPISRIIVGPSRHMGLSKVALEALLMQLGYPRDLVRLSKVPFRAI